MPFAEYDKIGQARTGYDRLGNPYAVRIAHVYDLSGAGASRLQAALDTVAQDFPRGSDHPDPGLNITLRRAEASPLANEGAQAMVRMYYGVADFNLDGIPVGDTVPAAELDVGSSLTPSRTCFDKNGNLITVTYNGTQYVTILDIERAISTLVLVRIELTSPFERSRRFVGTTNQFAWRGDPAFSWFCTDIRGRSSDGGLTYRVEYHLTYDSRGWLFDHWVENPDGTIPNDITPGNGYAVGTPVFDEDNFNDLQLV